MQRHGHPPRAVRHVGSAHHVWWGRRVVGGLGAVQPPAHSSLARPQLQGGPVGPTQPPLQRPGSSSSSSCQRARSPTAAELCVSWLAGGEREGGRWLSWRSKGYRRADGPVERRTSELGGCGRSAASHSVLDSRLQRCAETALEAAPRVGSSCELCSMVNRMLQLAKATARAWALRLQAVWFV